MHPELLELQDVVFFYVALVTNEDGLGWQVQYICAQWYVYHQV